jgi:hypothetical protein
MVHAATITVMNTNDSGTGSLRQALADANDGDTIEFDVAVTGTIMLTSSELLVNDDITISGPGANTLAVDGNAASRVFHIASGKSVTISGPTIRNGHDGTNGGGICNDASGGSVTLSVNNSTISSNSASSWGGAIQNDGRFGSATLTINKCDISAFEVQPTESPTPTPTPTDTATATATPIATPVHTPSPHPTPRGH